MRTSWTEATARLHGLKGCSQPGACAQALLTQECEQIERQPGCRFVQKCICPCMQQCVLVLGMRVLCVHTASFPDDSLRFHAHCQCSCCVARMVHTCIRLLSHTCAHGAQCSSQEIHSLMEVCKWCGLPSSALATINN